MKTVKPFVPLQEEPGRKCPETRAHERGNIPNNRAFPFINCWFYYGKELFLHMVCFEGCNLISSHFFGWIQSLGVFRVVRFTELGLLGIKRKLKIIYQRRKKGRNLRSVFIKGFPFEVKWSVNLMLFKIISLVARMWIRKKVGIFIFI